MEILYVCHRLPFPPKRGGKIRPFNMIKHLQSVGHSVTVASLARSQDEAEEGAGLKDHCSEVLVGVVKSLPQNMRMVSRLPTLTPSSMGYFYSPELKQKISDVLKRKKFDLIFVHCSSVAQYVEDVQGVHKMLDFGDMDSQKWLIYSDFKSFPLSMGYWLEGSKMLRAEKKLAAKFDFCSCTTRAELETLDSYGVDVATGWFPNGVDAEFFSPADDIYDENLLSFVGRMDYYPNQQAMFWFCEHVLPRLQQQRPELKLIIVGADPSPAVKKLAELKGVQVTGSVPDVRDYVRRSAVNIAPLAIARGTQNKILECMAMGVPVVTSVQASKGVDAVADEHFLVADSVDEYCAHIMRLLNDPEQRRLFAEVGRERVLAQHNWPSSMQRLEKLIDQCVAKSPATVGSVAGITS